MLDYKTIIRLKKLGLNNLAIANGAKCKWDSVDRNIPISTDHYSSMVSASCEEIIAGRSYTENMRRIVFVRIRDYLTTEQIDKILNIPHEIEHLDRAS